MYYTGGFYVEISGEKIPTYEDAMAFADFLRDEIVNYDDFCEVALEDFRLTSDGSPVEESFVGYSIDCSWDSDYIHDDGYCNDPFREPDEDPYCKIADMMEHDICDSLERRGYKVVESSWDREAEDIVWKSKELQQKGKSDYERI